MSEEADFWSWCPECGMVWADGRKVCAINGADAATYPVPPAVGEDIMKSDREYVRLAELLHGVAVAGVAHEDPRLKYVTVQIDRALWDGPLEEFRHLSFETMEIADAG